MKMKTRDLTDAALDYAVCEATGLLEAYPLTRKRFLKQWSGNSGKYLHPSTDWSQGGPIIDREFINLLNIETRPFEGEWAADIYRHQQTSTDEMGDEMYTFYPKSLHYGPTPLIAAMRCYAASKLGNEVDVPEELL